jgi:hypothetical protein
MTRAGVARGPGRCTRCGAEGVNRATCTGDKDSHEELGKGYTGPHLDTGNGSGPNRFEREYEEEEAVNDLIANETAEDDHVPNIPFEVEYTPPTPTTPPNRPGVFVVNLRLITRMPASTEQHLVDMVLGMADVIHLDTEFEELRYE